jgi:hypothetical protein
MHISTVSNNTSKLPILVPEPSSELAEFCGIMLGDGGISKYQVAVTLHSVDDKEYSVFVSDLIEKLFGIFPGCYKRISAQAITLVVSRIKLVEFLTEICGLKSGNKIIQSADMPDWIKENTDFKIACVRGLVDTDGSVFTHRYISKDKEYTYKKLSFTSMSEPLLHSVLDTLQEIGLHSRIGSNHDIRIDSKADMQAYFTEIGSHNPKHLKRFAT